MPSVDSIVDDILVHTTTLSEHVCLLKNLFQRLQRANLTARPSEELFNNGEKNYSTMEKECLAVVWGVRRFMLYLYGQEFVLQTDHEPLLYINKAKLLNGRIMRWAMFLQNYRIKIESM